MCLDMYIQQPCCDSVPKRRIFVNGGRGKSILNKYTINLIKRGKESNGMIASKRKEKEKKNVMTGDVWEWYRR